MSKCWTIKIEQNKDKISSYLEEILDRKTETGGLRAGFGLEPRIEILTRLISIGTYDLSEQRTIVHRAIFRWIKYSTPSLSTFYTALRTEIAHYEKREKLKTSILFLLNTSLQEHSPVSVLGHELTFHDWTEIREGFDVDTFFNNARSVLPTNLLTSNLRPGAKFFKTFTPVIISGTWREPSEAITQAVQAFDFYRTHLNLPVLYGRVTWQFGRSRPLAPLLPSPVYGLFNETGQYLAVYYTLDELSYKLEGVSSEQVQKADEHMKRFAEQTDGESTKSLVADGFLKYGEAMDSPNWDAAFLRLWQCLELVALNPDTNKQVISIYKHILRYDRFNCDLLDAVYDMRNELVHTGNFSDSQTYYVGYIKHLVEQVLVFAYEAMEKFENKKELKEFYSHLSLGTTILERRNKAIEYILEDRQNP